MPARPAAPRKKQPPKKAAAAEEAFIVTVGVPRAARDMHCQRILQALRRAGYQAGATSDESLIELGRRAQLATQENDPA